MLKIIDNRKPKMYTILSGNIPLGFCYGKIGEFNGLFLNNFSNLVFVSNPAKTWGYNVEVENYQPLQNEDVTITIG